MAKKVSLKVDCDNRPGIQDELDSLMQRLNFKVEKKEFTRCRVANIGATLFSARYDLMVPDGLDGEAMADEIEALTSGTRVNVV